MRALSKEASKKNRRCLVHVKVDTGMHRVGISVEKAVDLVKYISSLPNIEIEGLFTHFACADDPENSYTLLQFERFLKLKEILEKNNFKFKMYHCANSAAMLNFPQTHLDIIRIGIAMYGLRPSEKTFLPKLKPALSLKAKISYLKEVEKGEGISYGLTFKANKKSLIATIPIGYGDGYPRQLLNSGVVLVRGKRVPVVGNVTMDQIMIDVTDLNEIKIGDEVVIIGNQGKGKIEVNELSRALDTIDYEIICGITNRVPRIYVD
ncbi:Alanine racemase 2 [subsurface metagenome]